VHDHALGNGIDASATRSTERFMKNDPFVSPLLLMQRRTVALFPKVFGVLQTQTYP